MKNTVIGVFTNQDSAEIAINELKTNGFSPDEISILMKNKNSGSEVEENTGTKVVGGAVSGATTGAVIGGLAGLLASIAIPGIGAFFIGGPIAAALGLTGAAASVASGATTGAVAGGLLGALTGLGLSEDEARIYEDRITRGDILVAVPLRDEDQLDVEEIFRANGAEEIRTTTK